MSNATNAPLATTLEDSLDARVSPHRKTPSTGDLLAETMLDDVMAGIDETELEPFTEPCMDDIQFEELAFWLGDTPAEPTPSECPSPTECPCVTCLYETRHPQAETTEKNSKRPKVRGHFVYIPTPQSRELSPKIPVVALPRIQGVN